MPVCQAKVRPRGVFLVTDAGSEASLGPWSSSHELQDADQDPAPRADVRACARAYASRSQGYLSKWETITPHDEGCCRGP